MVRPVLAAVLLALIPAASAAGDVRVLAEREHLIDPDGRRRLAVVL